MSAASSHPGLHDDGAARHLVPGTQLPDVSLPATRGAPINLRRRAGEAVLYVYPWTGRPGLADPPGWDDIPGAHGSTPEAEGFRDHHADFASVGVTVFGLSMQSSEHQRELAQRLRLPFALLSDADHAFQASLRLPTFAAGPVHFLKRLTIFACDGAILRTFYPVHPPHTHARDVLDWIRSRGPG